jgi:hypothetical protein
MDETPEELAAYEKVLHATSIRDFDLDAFADGIIAHREKKGFHENPYGANKLSVKRLSWHMGWNERALQHRD